MRIDRKDLIAIGEENDIDVVSYSYLIDEIIALDHRNLDSAYDMLYDREREERAAEIYPFMPKELLEGLDKEQRVSRALVYLFDNPEILDKL